MKGAISLMKHSFIVELFTENATWFLHRWRKFQFS